MKCSKIQDATVCCINIMFTFIAVKTKSKLNNRPQIELSVGNYKDNPVVEIRFKYNQTIVDFDKMIVFIRGAKGKKDRISILSEATATIMRVY